MNQSLLQLASASPRRHEILLQLGIPHQVLHVPAPEGEDEPQHPGELAIAYVQRTAREKAIRATQWLAQQPMDVNAAIAHIKDRVLTADTTVVLHETVLGKPKDLEHARQILELLAGSTHYILTAIALIEQGQLHERISRTEVSFKNLSETEINTYCESGEAMGKAGAYGIQGRAAAFITHISGSYTGVMGLPAFETCELLSSQKAILSL